MLFIFVLLLSSSIQSLYAGNEFNCEKEQIFSSLDSKLFSAEEVVRIFGKSSRKGLEFSLVEDSSDIVDRTFGSLVAEENNLYIPVIREPGPWTRERLDEGQYFSKPLELKTKTSIGKLTKGLIPINPQYSKLNYSLLQLKREREQDRTRNGKNLQLKIELLEKKLKEDANDNARFLKKRRKDREPTYKEMRIYGKGSDEKKVVVINPTTLEEFYCEENSIVEKNGKSYCLDKEVEIVKVFARRESMESQKVTVLTGDVDLYEVLVPGKNLNPAGEIIVPQMVTRGHEGRISPIEFGFMKRINQSYRKNLAEKKITKKGKTLVNHGPEIFNPDRDQFASVDFPLVSYFVTKDKVRVKVLIHEGPREDPMQYYKEYKKKIGEYTQGVLPKVK